MMQPKPSLEVIKPLFLNVGLERYWEKYKQLVKPGFFIDPTITPEDQLSIGKSKIGGSPDTPTGFTWPDWEGHPMSFIAQINLEEFPISSIDQNYPTTGILHFFYPCDDDVLFSHEFLYDTFPKDQNVVLYTSNLSDLKRFQAGPDINSFSSCLMNFKFENTIPVNSFIIEKRFFDNDEEAYVLYEKFCSSYYEMCQHDIGFRFFGYINGLQYGSQDADTELLFQADTNDEIGMQWDLSGLLYFYITKEDMLNRDFNEVFTDLVGT
ncbi:YwqG family protein [Paenibacillus luteus]|uniref:YwqG family protein n=1 Tax=Paenibacillus luteus TaxID=2545753 RepID=UPI0013756401|nr:YwqG family protein [Paenibacillus luteus]